MKHAKLRLDIILKSQCNKDVEAEKAEKKKKKSVEKKKRIVNHAPALPAYDHNKKSEHALAMQPHDEEAALAPEQPNRVAAQSTPDQPTTNPAEKLHEPDDYDTLEIEDDGIRKAVRNEVITPSPDSQRRKEERIKKNQDCIHLMQKERTRKARVAQPIEPTFPIIGGGEQPENIMHTPPPTSRKPKADSRIKEHGSARQEQVHPLAPSQQNYHARLEGLKKRSLFCER